MTNFDTTAARQEYRAAYWQHRNWQRQRAGFIDEVKVEPADRWVPACEGTEVPTLYGPDRYLYVYNFATNEHGWLNMETDIVQMESPAR